MFHVEHLWTFKWPQKSEAQAKVAENRSVARIAGDDASTDFCGEEQQAETVEFNLWLDSKVAALLRREGL